MKNNNFILRTITGAVYVALIVSSVILHKLFFAILMLIFMIFSLTEFYSFFRKSQIKVQSFTGVLFASILYCIVSFIAYTNSNIELLIIILPLFFIIIISEIFLKNETPIQNTAITILGIIYIALPLSLLNFFYSPSFEENQKMYSLLLGYFILVWSNDTFAYLVGTKFGKRKLIERISPKKTWEGTIGGGLVSVLVSIILSLFFKELNIVQWIILSIIIVISGTFGDLAESMFKRSMNIKDSGKILPGHGGFMDRLDAVYISSPFVFLYLVIIFA
jgi:phosphatidate cytidylyltransferase